jgi:hypothetical protein
MSLAISVDSTSSGHGHPVQQRDGNSPPGSKRPAIRATEKPFSELGGQELPRGRAATSIRR